MNLRLRNAGVLLAGLGLLGGLASCSETRFGPPEREGPPALIARADGSQLWLLLKREEERSRHVGGGRRFSIGKWITESFYHFELHGHDPANAQRLWRKTLVTVPAEAGGRTAQARILGQEGEVVWIFLQDGPVALSSKDGRSLGDRSTIEERNPALKDQVPRNLDFYAFDRGLVFTAADGRMVRIKTPGDTAEAYVPPNDEYFRQIQFRATRWNGGYRTRDFLSRQMMLGERWLGLFNAKEAADAGDDGFGDKIATGEAGSNPDRIFYDTQNARRTFWSARIGRTKEFTEGAHERLFEVTRIPEAPEFLEAGILLQQGTKMPLRLKEPSGFLVVHKTRLGEEGRLAVTRLDDNLKTQWSTTLPYHELRNRYESAGHLLLYGTRQETVKGVTSSLEHLVSLNLSDGKLEGWNVAAEKRVD